jgi:hypothetical protein
MTHITKMSDVAVDYMKRNSIKDVCSGDLDSLYEIYKIAENLGLVRVKRNHPLDRNYAVLNALHKDTIRFIKSYLDISGRAGAQVACVFTLKEEYR